MTLSGPKNQSILLRIARWTVHLDLQIRRCIEEDESQRACSKEFYSKIL